MIMKAENKSPDMRPVSRQRGFTLVELMVSMVILLFVALAMMQTAMVSIDANTRNVLRDEGVRIAGEHLNELRLVDNENMVADYHGTKEDVEKQIRNMTATFSVTNTVTELAAKQAVQIDVNVQWSWRSQTYETTLSTIRAIE